MSSLRLSTRYAKSLISLAKEQDQTNAIYNDMLSLREVFQANRDFILLMKSPIVQSDKKESIVRNVFEGRLNEITYRFLQILIRKGREGYLDEIVNSYFRLYNEMNNISPVKLVTPIELDELQMQKIKDLVKRDSSVGMIELETEVDPKILGGYIIQYQDKLIDASVSSRLKTIRRNIEDSSYKVKF